MNWYGNNNEYKYAGEFVVTDLAKSEQLDTLRTLINGKKTSTGAFQKMLPMTLRFGVNFKIFKNLFGANGLKSDSLNKELVSISLDYIQGLSKQGARRQLNYPYNRCRCRVFLITIFYSKDRIYCRRN